MTSANFVSEPAKPAEAEQLISAPSAGNNENFTSERIAIVVSSFIGIAIGLIPVGILSFGVFIRPLSAMYGWNRGEISLVFTLFSLSMALAMPFAGRIIDRIGVRWPLLCSLMVFPLTIAAVPTAIDLFGLFGLYSCAVLAGLTGAASSSLAYVRIIAGNFVRRRGLVLGIAMSGVAFGGAVWPQVATFGLEKGGYALGFYFLAAAPIVIGLPCALVISRERRSVAVENDRALNDNADKGVAVKAGELVLILQTRLFWQLVVIFLLAALALHSIQVHLIPLLSDRGFSAATGANFASVMFGCSIIARVGVGWLFDRWSPQLVGAGTFVAGAIGIVLLIIGEGTVQIVLAAALLGLSAGAEVDLLAFLVGRLFRLAVFGIVYGILFGVFLVGSAVGPALLGIAFDIDGSYQVGLQIATAGLVLASVLLWFLPSHRSYRDQGSQ